MYEDSDSLKLEAMRDILAICRSPEGLRVLVQSETALGILSRTLREESKVLSEISLSILCCFLRLASFETYHPLLKANQCGDVTFRVLEFEVTKRSSVLADFTTETGDTTKLYQQSWLIQICVAILRLLAEDLLVEKKMVNRKLGSLLISLLSRDHEPLILDVLEFLQKLSIVREYKDHLLDSGVITSITHLTLTHKNLEISKSSMHVLFNLSFDVSGRIEILKEGGVAQLIDFLLIPGLRADSLKLLSLLASDTRIARGIATDDAVDLLMQLAVGFPGVSLGVELASVLASLAWMEPGLIAGHPLILDFFGRAVKGRDAGAFRILRNISLSEKPCLILTTLLNKKFPGWDTEIMNIAKSASDALLAEILGFIAGMPKKANSSLPQILSAGLRSNNTDACLHAVLASRGVTAVIPDLVSVACGAGDACIQAEALCALRLMPSSARLTILKTEKVEDALKRGVSSESEEVSSQARQLGTVLNFGEVFPGWREDLKRKRFLQANPGWSQFVEGSPGAPLASVGEENWVFFDNSTLAN